MGLLLILAGSALLLEKVHVLNFGLIRLLWAGVIVYGAVHVANGFSMNARGRIFWGTLVFFYGLYFLLRTFGSIEFRTHFFMPVTLVIVGAGFLMMYLNHPREWFSLILALVLIGVGSAIVMGKLEYLDPGDVWYIVRHFWPVLLILIGLNLLLKKGVKAELSP